MSIPKSSRYLWSAARVAARLPGARTAGLSLARRINHVLPSDLDSRVLLNSLPKSGTHLLSDRLGQVTDLRNSYVHIAHRVALAGSRDSRPFDGSDPLVDGQRLREAIARIPAGTFATGHLLYHDEILESLRSERIRMVFLIRDPRDVLVSRYNYIMSLRRHPLHEFITRIPDVEQRYRALILGRSRSPHIVPYQRVLKEYVGWLGTGDVTTVKFEDIVGDAGGGSNDVRSHELARVAAHCRVPLKPNAHYLRERSSATHRSGRIGSWTLEIPIDASQVLEATCLEEITAMGYS